jgi:hypothetical protein
MTSLLKAGTLGEQFEVGYALSVLDYAAPNILPCWLHRAWTWLGGLLALLPHGGGAREDFWLF